MMKKFIGKHRKILSLVGVLVAAVIISVMTFGGVVNDVIAGVFKGDTDMDKIEKNGSNKIVILEIVPQYGQQILGYTIPGFEPITKEAIQAYPVDNGGRLDLTSEDFTNATGWVVKEASGSYYVTDNKLEDAFNENVLAESMDVYNDADIEVIVKQANDLVASDITSCDLIYINNPKENNVNLLYYYDQIMNYNAENNTFSDKVDFGYVGEYYDSVTYEDTVAKELAMRLIRNATGRVTALDLEATMSEYYTKIGVTNTKSIFEIIGLDNYREYNHDDYIEAIRNAEKGSISEATDLNLKLANINTRISEQSKNAIFEITKDATYFDNEANKEEFKKLLKKSALNDNNTGTPLYVEANFDNFIYYADEVKQGYFDKFKSMSNSGAITMESSIYSAMSSVNASMSNAAMNTIDMATIDESDSRIENIKGKLIADIFERLNFDIYIEYNHEQYVEALCEVEGITSTELLALMTKVNEDEKFLARKRIAEAASNEALVTALTDRDFVVADLSIYDKDLLDKYKEKLLTTDSGDLIQYEVNEMPVYTDDATSNVIVHFKADVDWASSYVKVEYLAEGATDYEVLEEKALAEEIVNGYYRVVLGAMPEGTVLDSLRLTFSNAKTIEDEPIEEESTTEEGETEESTEEESTETPENIVVESLEPMGIGVNSAGNVYGEYWFVYNADGEGRAFLNVDDIKSTEGFGYDYAYEMQPIVTINEENILAVISEVNDEFSMLPGEVTYDLYSWDIAAELYNYSTTDENGLIFSTEIIKEIAKCKYDSNKIGIRDDLTKTADRTNLVYKALLSIKLSAAGIFDSNTLAKVDEEGLYYADGIEAGNGVEEWSISLFSGSASTKIPLYSLAKRVFTYSNTALQVRFNGEGFIKYNYDINMKTVFDKSSSITNAYTADYKRNWNNIFDKKEESEDASNAYGYYTLGDIIRYTMNLYINELYSYPLRVLEIQPAAMVSDFGTYSNNDAKFEGAKKIADWLRIDYSEMTSSNYSKYISVRTMSVREFNTQNKNLTAEYDLIYFGVNSGYMRRSNTNERTVYNDTSLNGYVYTSIGDKYTIVKYGERGSLWIDYEATSGYTYNNLGKVFKDQDYNSSNLAFYNYQRDYKIWLKYFTKAYEGQIDENQIYTLKNSYPSARAGANDITVKKSKELMEYLKAGYPILFDDKVLYANKYKSSKQTTDYNKWSYVDFNSKLYHFVEDAKALGYDEESGKYTGKDEDGNDVFADGGKYASLVSTTYAKYGSNPENLSSEDKFKGGLSFATKRNFQIDFEYKSGPLEYDTGIAQGQLGNIIPYKNQNGTKNKDYSEYKFVLGVPEGIDMEWLEENYGFQMHVDKSGLGKFTDENTIQLDPDVDFNLGTREIIIEGNWPTADDDSMGGFIPWRMEVYLKTNPNSHYVHTGYSAFEKIDKNGNPKNEVIEVLYVMPEQKLNFNFKTQIVDLTKGDNPTYYLPEYTINCTSINYSELSNGGHWEKDDDGIEYNSTNTKLTVGEFNDEVGATEERYKKEFNMIVFGYCDSYTGMDIDNINALRNIDYFVSSGHSLIFSHDNSGEIASVNNYSLNGKKSNGNWNLKVQHDSYYYGKYTTSYMRAMLGMDAFGVSYSPKAFIYGYERKSDGTADESKPVSMEEADENTVLNPYFVEAMYNARLYIDDSSDPEIFRGLCEGTVLRQKSGGAYSLAYNNGLGDQIAVSLPTTTQVRFTNKGQITMYPYVLGDTTVTILPTHFQYQSLNLEDEDIQVWATFDSNDATNYYGATRGDGANGYYIYTKGNITYSGTGHSGGSNNEMERKLFLNTVVAAIKSGNYGPEIDFTNSDAEQNGESIIYSYDSEDFVTLKFKVTDVDSKAGAVGVFSNIDIFFDKIGDTDSNGNDDDSNPFYQEASDIILNKPDDDIDIMYDETCQNKVNYTAENVENRVEYTIKISYEDIANMYDDLYPDNSYTTIDDKVKAFFDEYRFAVTATDIPKEINGTNTKGTGITKSAVARVAFRSLFNLN